MTFRGMGSAALKASQNRYAVRYERAQKRQELHDRLVKEGYAQFKPPIDGASWNKGDEWLNADGEPVQAPSFANAPEVRTGDMLRERANQAINSGDLGLALYVVCHKTGLTIDRVSESLAGGDSTDGILRLFDDRQVAEYARSLGVEVEGKERMAIINAIDIAHRSADKAESAPEPAQTSTPAEDKPKRRGRPRKQPAEA